MFFDLAAQALKRYRSFHAENVVTVSASGRTRGRAVVLHKTDPLVLPKIRRFDDHSNLSELLNIVGVLANLGFEVTVVDRSCPMSDLPTRQFDLVVGLAAGNSGRNLVTLFERSPAAVKIAYCAGPEPGWSNMAITARYADAFARKRLPPPEHLLRVIDGFDFKSTLLAADALIVHGNQWTVSTYQDMLDLKAVYSVSGIALSRAPLAPLTEREPLGLLAVGGSGAIVKGIDLFFDAASEMNGFRFGYCGNLESDFLTLFEDSPMIPTNLETFGFVYAGSRKFRRITRRFAFGVLPSCSEGMATSVLTMMAHGLIPIVTKECGVDVQQFGLEIKANQDIVPALRVVQGMSHHEIERRRAESHASGQLYSRNLHHNQLSRALQEILEERRCQEF